MKALDGIGHCHPNEHHIERIHKFDLPRKVSKQYHGAGGHIGHDPNGAPHGTLKQPAKQTFKRTGS